jgi:AcrR family transcriptional regulator
MPVMKTVLEAVAERLIEGDELLIRIPEICEATGINYGSVYHHFGSREGVIDAAYNMIFSQLVEEDLATLENINDSVTTREEYLNAMVPVVAMMSSGSGRRSRRAMRVRIVAAALTRPELRVLIGATQTRLTDELRRLVAFAQDRQWLREDLSPAGLAVVLQALVFGRSLDDVAATPLEDDVWASTIGLLFLDLLKR